MALLLAADIEFAVERDPDGVLPQDLIQGDELMREHTSVKNPHDPDLETHITALGLVWDDVVETDIEFLDVVHLAFSQNHPDDSLFVWIEVGSEKMRYLQGSVIAIDLTGEIIHGINLSDIYSLEGVTSRAEY